MSKDPALGKPAYEWLVKRMGRHPAEVFLAEAFVAGFVLLPVSAEFELAGLHKLDPRDTH